MELVTTFKSLSEMVLDKYDNIPVTMGILLADYRQTEAREYILNYLNRFDNKSGKYIDFYLPGYYMYAKESENEWEIRSHQNMCISRHCSSKEPIYLNRLNERFYFADYLFEDFLCEFEKRTGIAYTYNPMLILVEVNKSMGYGAIEFQDKMIIELDDGNPGGVKRSGMLFEKIFEIAKEESGLNLFKKEMRISHFRGNAIKTIVKTLDGNLIEAVTDTMEGIRKYHIKRK